MYALLTWDKLYICDVWIAQISSGSTYYVHIFKIQESDSLAHYDRTSCQVVCYFSMPGCRCKPHVFTNTVAGWGLGRILSGCGGGIYIYMHQPVLKLHTYLHLPYTSRYKWFICCAQSILYMDSQGYLCWGASLQPSCPRKQYESLWHVQPVVVCNMHLLCLLWIYKQKKIERDRRRQKCAASTAVKSIKFNPDPTIDILPWYWVLMDSGICNVVTVSTWFQFLCVRWLSICYTETA